MASFNFSLNSTVKCNQGGIFEEYFIRCFESKTFSGSVVESLHNEFDFSLSDRCEAVLLRKVRV